MALDVGALVQMPHCEVIMLELQTKSSSHRCVCIRDTGEQILVNGQPTNENESAVLRSQLQ